MLVKLFPSLPHFPSIYLKRSINKFITIINLMGFFFYFSSSISYDYCANLIVLKYIYEWFSFAFHFGAVFWGFWSGFISMHFISIAIQKVFELTGKGCKQHHRKIEFIIRVMRRTTTRTEHATTKREGNAKKCEENH